MLLGDGGTRLLIKPLVNYNLFSFYINLPIGAVTAVMIAWFLPVPILRPVISLRQKLREIDYQGAIFLIP
jgi:hypothetical protein